MYAWFRTLVLVMAGVLAFGGCATSMPTPLAAETASSVQQASAADEYRLGVADKVRVTVYGEEEITGEYTVGSSGRISLPLIGEVAASGLTITEFQTGVTSALAQGYINNPRVSAEVLTYRPFYILGEVKKPGTYPYTNNLTVLNAVATAEGFTYRANTRQVFIRRGDGSSEEAVSLTTSTMVQPGDTIRIGERYF